MHVQAGAIRSLVCVIATLVPLACIGASASEPWPSELKLATWNLEWFMKPETLRALTPGCLPSDAPRDGARRAVPWST